MITVTLPPLRERVEDIEPLVKHFLRLQTIEGQVQAAALLHISRDQLRYRLDD